jgi:hypothetical protein
LDEKTLWLFVKKPWKPWPIAMMKIMIYLFKKMVILQFA